MPRSLWSGAISFGLVNVPVKLFTAVRTKDVRFHQLHKADGVRIKQKRVCPNDNEEVPYEDIVKGYEIASGQYVIIEPEELEALDPSATHTIEIEDFVDLAEIDPLYYESSYYVMPDDRGVKAYRLLVKAMAESKKVGIARVVMRTKQYLAAVRPMGDVLVLSTMNYPDEIAPVSELGDVPDSHVEVGERELRMANQLIESLAAEFDPTKYKDSYREQVLDLIERKADGQEIVSQPAAEKPTPVVDLMAALEASLAAAKATKPAAKETKETKEKKAPARRKKAS
ncbi:MAG TPA: Ku protein [Acidimicrobiales bacterium]|nr:Ku protein [Acidimicrobiales bacterium]